MDDNSLTNTVSELIKTTGKLRVRSALNPILWLCGITLSIGFGVIAAGLIVYSTNFPFNLYWIIVLVLIGVPLLLTSFGFIYILLKIPDMLQSEEYQLKKRELDSREKNQVKEGKNPVKEEEDLVNDN